MAGVDRVVARPEGRDVGDARPARGGGAHDGLVIALELDSPDGVLEARQRGVVVRRARAQGEAPHLGLGREVAHAPKHPGVGRLESLEGALVRHEPHLVGRPQVLGARGRRQAAAHHLVASPRPSVIVDTHVDEDHVGQLATRADEGADAAVAVPRREPEPLDHGPRVRRVGDQVASEAPDHPAPPGVLDPLDARNVDLPLVMHAPARLRHRSQGADGIPQHGYSRTAVLDHGHTLLARISSARPVALGRDICIPRPLSRIPSDGIVRIRQVGPQPSSARNSS